VAFLGYEFFGALQVVRNPAAAPPVPTTQVNGKEVVVFTSIAADKLPTPIKEAEGKLDQNVSGRSAFSLGDVHPTAQGTRRLLTRLPGLQETMVT
jgi:hypothetical protein